MDLMSMLASYPRRRTQSPNIIAAAETLGIEDQFNQVTNGTYTITLPSVAAAAGRIYAFSQIDAATGTVTIAAQGADTTGYTSQIMNAAGESVILMSLGNKWAALQGQTS